jgi:excinuclease ABC subunit C
MARDVHKALRERLKTVPRTPGVYLFKGARGAVIYVGKAKDLRARLRSYFQTSIRLDPRKARMVAEARDLSTIAVSSELEAFALEATLIKQHRPRYNVLLRDDKGYPYLKLTTTEQWPRLEVVRRTARDGAEYFGPYIPASAMWEALEFIKRTFAIRPCRYRLDRPMRPCIQHQMGRCPAPCAGLVSDEAYARMVKDVSMFLCGRSRELVRGLRARMLEHSDAMRFEEAAEIRDRIASLERAWESQKVVAPELGDIDAVGVHVDVDDQGNGDAAVQLFLVRGGTMIGARDFVLRDMAGVPMAELLREFLLSFYSGPVSPPPEVLLPMEPDDGEALLAWLNQRAMDAGSAQRVAFRVPVRGKRRELLSMAEENARLALERRRAEGAATHEDTLEEIGARLGLGFTPRSVAAFDISNLTGSDPVAGFVWWEEGEFRKNRYRHMRIRDVEGIDDYAMMREAVVRVLGRADDPKPDLVVIDGGRGHLDAAREALRGLPDMPRLVGVAKKPDRAFLPEREEPVDLSGREPSSLLLRRVRDEVHRFAVGYHQKLRGERMLSSPLESIPGIGRKRRLELLRAFGSLDGMRSASVDDLSAVKGITRPIAAALYAALNGEDLPPSEG